MMNPNNWDVDAEVKDADYVAANGDRYFSVDDFWVVVTYEGQNKPQSIRVVEKGAEN